MAVNYDDRVDAARRLAEHLEDYADRSDVIVLGLPRGGVPVAAEIARALDAELDILLVRKLGHPQQPELAMGAIATGGVRVMNADVADRVPEDQIDRVAKEEQQELERRQNAYRGDRPLPDLKGKTALLVDDGLATGATMRAGVKAVRELGASRVVVAVPVGPPDRVEALKQAEGVDEVVCPATPTGFMGIGQFYRDFSQVPDDEVREALQRVWDR